MKIEDQDLLLKDLCGRLPYWVKCIVKSDGYIGVISSIESQYGIATFDNGRQEEICDIKPYLFPLSSLEDRHKEDLVSKHLGYYQAFDGIGRQFFFEKGYEVYDWLNKNHFDYRDLIAKGLAIDAIGLNIYKEETE